MLEGGFDSHDRFFFIPLSANEALSEIWRRRAVQWPALGVVALFLSKGLLNHDFADRLLNGRHSDFSIQSETRIYDQEARQALSQYIVRPRFHWRRSTGMRSRTLSPGSPAPQDTSGAGRSTSRPWTSSPS